MTSRLRQRPSRMTIAIALMAGALALATTLIGSAANPSGKAQASGAPAATCDVQANASSWTPDHCELALGGQVTWHFDDPPATTVHDVRLVAPGDDPATDSFEAVALRLPNGDPGSHTFDELGTWTFYCSIHASWNGSTWVGSPPMVGTVDVVEGGGEPLVPDLRAVAQPKKRTIGASTRQTSFSLRLTSTGTASTGPIRVCARAPKARIKVVGKACRQTASLAPGASRRETFRFRPTRAARGKTTAIRLVASGPNVPTRAATVKLTVRRR